MTGRAQFGGIAMHCAVGWLQEIRATCSTVPCGAEGEGEGGRERGREGKSSDSEEGEGESENEGEIYICLVIKSFYVKGLLRGLTAKVKAGSVLSNLLKGLR